jgi:hypothetical protein
MCACIETVVSHSVFPSFLLVPFQVDIKGRGLSGDLVLVLGPLETGSYELLYQPLVIASEKGRVAFDNDEIGEFWYELTLNGLSPEDNHVPRMECEVGSSVEETVSIENPIDEDVTMKVSSCFLSFIHCLECFAIEDTKMQHKVY